MPQHVIWEPLSKEHTFTKVHHVYQGGRERAWGGSAQLLVRRICRSMAAPPSATLLLKQLLRTSSYRLLLLL